MTTSFSCHQALDDSQLVEVTGELDLHTSPELDTCLSALTDTEASPYVLDLSDVTFVDSTALGVLVAAHHSSAPLRIVTSNPQVLNVLRLTGLNDVFSVFCTREEALKAVRRAARRNHGAASLCM